MKRIDSHQHYWRLSRGDYDWITPALPQLCHDFMPDDLAPHLRRHGIEKTVLVQAAQSEAETDFLLTLANREPSVAGVVGWLDLDGTGFQDRLMILRQSKRFVGLRPMLPELADDDWILRDRVQDNLALLAESDVPFECLCLPRHLPHIVKTLERHPSLRMVIDHLSKPAIRAKLFTPWSDLIAQVAQFPQVYCKASGMVTEADHQHWKLTDLVPYFERAWAAFGPDRMMFGSDWPVCNLAATYDDVVEAATSLVRSVATDEEAEAFFGGNCSRFYRL